jgi:hypothetical protein
LPGDKRSVEDILRDDTRFRRFIELNLELLSDISRIQYGEINRVHIKDGKLLVKHTRLIIDGAVTES